MANSPLYPLSWGWNASGRAGNLTHESLYIPSSVQHIGGKRFIGGACGKHHSVIVSDDGNMFSFGENRKGQLGYGNAFTKVKKNQPSMQCYPRQVTPSGTYVLGHDINISQVGCGANFTVGREISCEEGIDRVEGLRELYQKLEVLYAIYGDCEPIQRAWAAVRQEKFIAVRSSQGSLVVWGVGARGQLGLGEFCRKVDYPVVIKELRHVNIQSIAVGHSHVLAMSTSSFLYSWGSGQDGRLGHGDFLDRFSPERVKFLDPFFVEGIAAGKAHSALLVTSRKGLPREKQLKRVVTFGRGAHGRLGSGTNACSFLPITVKLWPQSAHNIQFKQVVCGGAHTLVLAYRIQPKKTLANPWQVRTYVYAFGFGTNGQLGDGTCRHQFTPTLARTNKWDIICEISAGKSWSMARTLSGDLYTWGMGFRGQLGQGRTVRFSLLPQKVTNVMPIVKLSSGYAHNLCMAVPRRYLNAKTTEKAIGSKNVLDHSFVYMGLKQTTCVTTNSVCCCRRIIKSVWLSRMRYACLTCNIECMCYNCAVQCHRGHDLRLRNDDSGVNILEKNIVPVNMKPLVEKYMNKSLTRPTTLVATANVNRIPVLQLSDETVNVLDLRLGVDPLKYTRVAHDENSDRNKRGPARKKQFKIKEKKERVACTAPPLQLRNHKRWVPYLLILHRQLVALDEENFRRKKLVEAENTLITRRALQLRSKKKEIKLVEFVALKLPPKPSHPVPLCDCSVRFNSGMPHKSCHLLSTITEVDEERYVKLGERHAYNDKQYYLSVIANCARKFVLQSHIQATEEKRRIVSRAVYRQYWEKSILEKIWYKIETSFAEYRQPVEVNNMMIEDDNIHKYYFYQNLQKHLSAMDAMMYGVREVVGCSSAMVGRYEIPERALVGAPVGNPFMKKRLKKVKIVKPKSREKRSAQSRRKNKKPTTPNIPATPLPSVPIPWSPEIEIKVDPVEIAKKNKVTMLETARRTFAFSYVSLRQLILNTPVLMRSIYGSHEEILVKTRNLARYDRCEGKYFDPDVYLLISRFIRDAATERWRAKMNLWLEKAALAKIEAEKKRKALLRARIEEKKNVIERANAILHPAPPRGPPPESALRAFIASARKEKLEKKLQLDEDYRKKIAKAESAFDQFDRHPTKVFVRRRHSITSPDEGFYNRVKEAKFHLEMKNMANRRYSLPPRVSVLYGHERPVWEYARGIRNSLSEFRRRKQILTEWVDLEKYDKILWKGLSRYEKKMRLRSTLRSSAWCTPKLPRELIQMYRGLETDIPGETYIRERSRFDDDDDALFSPYSNHNNVSKYGRERRNSIGEPERLQKQFSELLDIRQSLKKLRNRLKKLEKMPLRRRSFDINEERECEIGVTDGLGLEYEAPFDKQSKFGLEKDSTAIELRLKTMKKWGEKNRSNEEWAYTHKLLSKTYIIKKLDYVSKKASKQAEGTSMESRFKKFGGDSGIGSVMPVKKRQQQSSKAGISTPVVVIWQEHYSEEGYVYYYCPESGESTWEYPVGDNVQLVQQYQDEESGGWYWFNSVTGEAQWM